VNVQCLTQFGLILDILGVTLLFFATTYRRIEEEFGYGLAQETVDMATVTVENPETGEVVTGVLEPGGQKIEDLKRQLPDMGRRVRGNHARARVGLGLIVSGFVIQLVGTFSF